MAEHQKGRCPGMEELEGGRIVLDSHEGHHTQDTADTFKGQRETGLPETPGI